MWGLYFTPLTEKTTGFNAFCEFLTGWSILHAIYLHDFKSQIKTVRNMLFWHTVNFRFCLCFVKSDHLGSYETLIKEQFYIYALINNAIILVIAVNTLNFSFLLDTMELSFSSLLALILFWDSLCVQSETAAHRNSGESLQTVMNSQINRLQVRAENSVHIHPGQKLTLRCQGEGDEGEQH